MKKFTKLLIVTLFVVCPLRVHAAGAIAASTAAVIAAIGTHSGVQILQFIEMVKNNVKTVENTLNNVKLLTEAERKAWNNLKSIVDVRSIDDFVKWTNRTMYLAREEEYYYNQMGVQIGKNTYKMTEIDQIPDALRNSFRDPWDRDYTDQEKEDMWIRLGLTPGNYNYMKTWQERNDKIAKRIMTYSDIYADEAEEAYARNQNIMDKYSVSSDTLDANEIAKEAHITAMNTEMAIREQTRLMIEMQEYQLSRDRMADTPPSQVKRSSFWGENPFGSITSRQGTNSYENW